MRRVNRRWAAVATLAVLLAGCGAAADGTTTQFAEPIGVRAPADDIAPTRLGPPEESQHGEAEIVVLIDEGSFDRRWNDLRGLALSVGGQVSAASTGITEYRGDRYEFGTVTMVVSTDRFDDAIGRVESLGEAVSSSFRLVTSRVGSDSTIVATITESPGVITTTPAPDGRVQRALDTAGDILLTVLSVVIVAGAVLIPIGLVALLGLAVWRRIAPPTPVRESAPTATQADEEELVDN